MIARSAKQTSNCETDFQLINSCSPSTNDKKPLAYPHSHQNGMSGTSHKDHKRDKAFGYNTKQHIRLF